MLMQERQPPGANARMAAKAAQRAHDLELMQRISLDDEEAIDALYTRFGGLVYRMATQALSTPADAEDAVQEIFVRLWRTAGRFDPERAALATWVMLITRRFLVDRLRRARVRGRPASLVEAWSPPASGRDPEATVELGERFGAVMKRIETLPELQRDVLKRAYLRGQTLREIGEELNRPLGTIKSTLSRALVRLRESGIGEEAAA